MKIYPMASQEAILPLLKMASGVSAGDKTWPNKKPELCRISAIDNPNMIRLYGELSLFGERQIVKQRKEDAEKETIKSKQC
jgi:hypothetical protein